MIFDLISDKGSALFYIILSGILTDKIFNLPTSANPFQRSRLNILLVKMPLKIIWNKALPLARRSTPIAQIILK